MKKQILSIACVLTQFVSFGQSWQSVGFPGPMVYTADTFQGKLFIGTGAFPTYSDGTTWSTLANYNNSSNTPNKSKYCARNIDNLLYLGAKDFNSSREGIVHTYDGTNVTEKQAHRQFAYNGSRKVLDFVKANGKTYMATNDSLFYWDNTAAKWDVIQKQWGFSGTDNIKLVRGFKNKLVVVTNSELFIYDGTTFDSLNFSNMTPTNGTFYSSSVSDVCIANDTLYATGTFNKVITISPPSLEKGNLLKYYTGGMQISDVAFAGYDGIGMNRTKMGKIFVDPASSKIYVSSVKNDSIGDVYLSACSQTGWKDVSLLVRKGQGYIPSVPGSELADYNLIFVHQNQIYVGGRFYKINGDSIPALARWVGGTSTGLKSDANQTKLVSVYPNPVHEKLFISEKADEVKVYTKEGKIVLEAKGEELNFSNLPAGIYFVEIRKSEQVQRQKVLKQ